MFNDDENKPFLQYDELGFIIGLKQTGRDISKIDKTTEEIRDILLGFQRNLEQSLLSKYSAPKPKLSALEQALIDAQIKPVDSDDLLKEMANPIAHAALALDKVAKTLDDLIEESIPELKRNRSQNLLQRQAVELDSPESVIREFSNRGNEQGRDNSTAVNQQTETTRAVDQSGPKSGASAEHIDPIPVQRERDSRGRFIDSTAVNQQTETTRAAGQSSSPPSASAEQIDPIQVQRERDSKGRFVGGESESKSTLGKIAQTIGTVIKGSISGTPQGVDPTVDAINEVATVLSPVKRAAGFMLRPLTGLMKSRKRNEPLPREQEQHNRRQIKLLQRIADRVGNSGSGLFGLLRFLPLVLGAIAGIGGVIAAGFTAAAPVIAAAVGGAIALWAAGKGKEILDNLVDRSRPVEQGDMNPDGSSNKGVVGWANRKAKGFMNGVRGTANSAIGAVTGNYEVFDDGTGEYSKNRVGLKTDAINQDGKYLYQQQYGGSGVNESKPVQSGGGEASSSGGASLSGFIGKGEGGV